MRGEIIKSSLFLGLALLVAGVVGCGQGGGAPPPKMLVISPDTATVTLECVRQFTAVVYDTDNNVMNVNPSWEVTGGIGTITGDGLFTATVEGSGFVKAAYGDQSTVASVSVRGNFFPHEIGYSWTYSKPGSDETFVATVAGISSSIITGETVSIFHYCRKDGEGNIILGSESNEYYKITDSGVYLCGNSVGENTALCSPPMTALSFPLSIGKTWTGNYFGLFYNYTVKSFENVAAPAGNFKCYKIEIKINYNSSEINTFYVWYGNNAGIVKIIDDYGVAKILESKNF